MKLYDAGRAPNPRRVKIFLAEKGIAIETVQFDINKLEQYSAEITKINPMNRLPILELDNGAHISESVAICRYFEEIQPDPPLMGIGAEDKAIVEMWSRRTELNFLMPVAFAFRHLHPAMREMEKPQIAEWGEANKSRAADFLPVLNQQLAQVPFVAGERFTIADITAFITCQFMKPARITMPEELANVARWFAEIGGRPSMAY